MSRRTRLKLLCLLPMGLVLGAGFLVSPQLVAQARSLSLAEATPAPPPPPAAQTQPPPAVASAAPVARPGVMQVLTNAAHDQGVDPNLLLAVSFWESGWHQDRVSSEGAVGLLQVMPKTAATAGPQLLGRPVDINDPSDNAEVGAALLKDLLNKYDHRTALAAYYQGEPALLSGTYAPDTWHYADSILSLSDQIAAGRGPAGP